MRIAIITLALLVFAQGWSHAATRTWKSRKGEEIKAEFVGGVLDNKIVLKVAGNRRLYIRFSEFSLADRDYLVDYFTKRNNPKEQLMLAENKVPVIDPDKPATQTGDSNSNEAFPSNPGVRNPLARNPFNPLENPNVAAQQPASEIPTEMYGIPLPSPELLVEDQVRTWTNLTGMKSLFTFDRALAPGFFRLKKADGTSADFAMVNFSREDIDYVKQVLQTDMARPVFPEGNGFQSLTPEDVSKGYRVWTDRKNVPLIGKFVAAKAKNVVIEVDGQEQEYPKAGLSEADQTWVNNEVRRRAEAAQAAAQQAAASRNPGTAGSPFSRSRFSPFGTGGGSGHGENAGDNRFGMGSHDDGSNNRFGSGGMGRTSFPTLQYTFNCEHCGKTWTGPTPISSCSNCAGKYHFSCDKCGHKWTRTDSMFSACPRCSPHASSGSSYDSLSTTSSGSSNSASGTKDGQGVLMTVLYVVMGLSVLGGIATGLFKTFG